jgi:hypothetical protein
MARQVCRVCRRLKSVLPEDVDWKPFPAFPPSARLAVLLGEPTKPAAALIGSPLPY